MSSGGGRPPPDGVEIASRVRDPDEDFVELEGVEVTGETDLAIGFRYDEHAVMVPKSCVDWDRTEVAEVGDVGSLFLALWMAEKKDLV